MLNCIGQNNEDATMPLRRVNWFFTTFGSQVPWRSSYNNTDPRVNEIRLPNNIINSTFVINSVMVTDGGVYGCQVLSEMEYSPLSKMLA